MLRTAHRYPTSLPVAFPEVRGAPGASALNISTNGMFVRTDLPLQRGALVDIAVAFPDGEPPAPGKARVVYVGPGSGSHGLGMQFVEGEIRARVHRHIDGLIGRAPALRLLTSAREMLRERGWTQLTAENADGRLCLSGALRRAAAGNRSHYQQALSALGARLGIPGCHQGGFGCHCAVIRWNDAEERTPHQVIAKLDEAIDAELSARR